MFIYLPRNIMALSFCRYLIHAIIVTELMGGRMMRLIMIVLLIPLSLMVITEMMMMIVVVNVFCFPEDEDFGLLLEALESECSGSVSCEVVPFFEKQLWVPCAVTVFF